VDIVAGGTHAFPHGGMYILVLEFGFLMAIITKGRQIGPESYGVPVLWVLSAPFFHMTRIATYL
jgi:hypothetical protein